MVLSKIIKVLLLLLGGVFIVLQGMAFEVEATAVGALMLILLTTLYCGWTKDKVKLFFGFLVLFTLGQVLSYMAWYMRPKTEEELDYFYYGANICFIISYIFLIIRIGSELNIKKVFSELAIPLIILVLLDIFCVVLVTDTAKGELSFMQYSLEFVYNATIMLLLSFALINYMFRNDNKSMLLLLGSIFIVFSEIIQLAYYYILEEQSLGFIYSLFLVVAFLFFYQQSQLQFTGPIEEYVDEQLEV